MTEHEGWYVLACIAGLTLTAWAHTWLYRKLRADVDFLLVVVPHETEMRRD